MRTKKPAKKTKAVSIDQDLLQRTIARARAEDRSWSFIVCRAIRRDLEHGTVQPKPAKPLAAA